MDTPEKESTPLITISANTSLDGYRLKNFYLTNSFQGFTWMLFHFSVVFFFTFQLQSVILVGIFLGIANAIAFLLDIPIGILQRYYSTKKLFLIGAISQLIAVGIFFNFIYGAFQSLGGISKIIIPEGFESAVSWFFGNGLNWLLLLVASFCYGITKEINDISTFGYILSHAHPSEYGKIIARNNISYGIGSLLGLIVSGVVLSMSPKFSVFFLGIIVILFLIFTSRFFDNANESISLSDITSFTIGIKKLNKENILEYISEKVHAVDLPKILESSKYIFFKPQQKETHPLKWGIVFSETKQTIKIIGSIILHKPPYMIIYWTISLVLIFGFWDTFASTFLIKFLSDIGSENTAYLLLACIAIPALGLQEFASRISEKIGVKTVAIFGLIISGISLLSIGCISFGYEGGYTLGGISIIVLSLINSIGYACGMALGQNQFLESYNTIYAEKMNLKEIDSNASAGPIKILQNGANVIGLVFGGLFLEIFGYSGFFIIFGIIILLSAFWSYKKYDEIQV